jgi:hypothetical protein
MDQYYDELPGEKHKGYRGTYAGVDLAFLHQKQPMILLWYLLIFIHAVKR